MKKRSVLVCIAVLALTVSCSEKTAPENIETPNSEPVASEPKSESPSPDKEPDSSLPALDQVWYGEGFVIPEDKINLIEDVSLIIENEINPESYLIRNETEEVIWFGANDRIELKTAEGWKKIQAMAEAPAIGYMLEPGNEEKLWIRRDNMIDMIEGTYRVIMEFNLTETDITGKDVPGKDAYYVSSEFEIQD